MRQTLSRRRHFANRIRSPLQLHHRNKLVRKHESNYSLDYLSHPLSGQSQTTHHQPHLHRRSRPSALRMQRRLPRRILRRCSAHRASPNLRGHLRPLARHRRSRAGRYRHLFREFAATGIFPLPGFRQHPASSSQTSSTRTQPPQPHCRLPLLVRVCKDRLRVSNAQKNPVIPTGAFPSARKGTRSGGTCCFLSRTRSSFPVQNFKTPAQPQKQPHSTRCQLL